MNAVAGVIAVVLWLSAAVSGAVDVNRAGADDPMRYCYAVVDNQPWSCYLADDRPDGYTPVWVGPESEVATAYVNQ